MIIHATVRTISLAIMSNFSASTSINYFVCLPPPHMSVCPTNTCPIHTHTYFVRVVVLVHTLATDRRVLST